VMFMIFNLTWRGFKVSIYSLSQKDPNSSKESVEIKTLSERTTLLKRTLKNRTKTRTFRFGKNETSQSGLKTWL